MPPQGTTRSAPGHSLAATSLFLSVVLPSPAPLALKSKLPPPECAHFAQQCSPVCSVRALWFAQTIT
eukprot:3649289-Pleurochrysis_carterae.AAC.1